MGWPRGHPQGGCDGAMMPEEIKKDDQLIRESDGFVFWTALKDADEPYGGEVHVAVRFHDGGRGDRWLPVGRPLPIRRPGVSL